MEWGLGADHVRTETAAPRGAGAVHAPHQRFYRLLPGITVQVAGTAARALGLLPTQTRGAGKSGEVGIRSKLDALDRRFVVRPGEGRGEPPRVGEHPLLLGASLALLMVPVMSILLIQTVRNELEDNRVRATLQRDEAAAKGTVTGLRHPQRWNVFPDAIRVEFVTETGETVRSWMPVSHRQAEGALVEVRYYRSNPSAARLPGDETPHRGRWKLVAIAGPGFTLALILLMTLSERFRRQRADRPSYWTGRRGSI